MGPRRHGLPRRGPVGTTAAGRLTAAGRSRSAIQPSTRSIAPTCANLQVAWTYDAGEPTGRPAVQPDHRRGRALRHDAEANVIALDAATGALRWRFDFRSKPVLGERQPRRHLLGARRRPADLHRAGQFVYALDARTGTARSRLRPGRPDRPARESGPSGRRQSIRLTTPGVVYKDLLIVGGLVPRGPALPPGDIRAFDARSGTLRWTFHTIPRPGESGHETWPADAWSPRGRPTTGRAWRSTGARARLRRPPARPPPTSTAPTGWRQPATPTRSSRSTPRPGKRLWHFQAVRHDIWDRDLPVAAEPGHGDARGPSHRRRRADHEVGLRLPLRARDRAPLFPDRIPQGARLRPGRRGRPRRRSRFPRHRRRSRGRCSLRRC